MHVFFLFSFSLFNGSRTYLQWTGFRISVLSALYMEIKIGSQAAQSFETGFDKDIFITGSTSKVEKLFSALSPSKYMDIQQID